MVKFLKKCKRTGLIVAIIAIVITIAAITIFGTMLIGERKHRHHNHEGKCCASCAKNLPCEDKASSKDASNRENVKSTLDNLNTNKTISEFTKATDNPMPANVPKKPNVASRGSPKLTTSDGAVEFSMEKLSVLPSAEAVGSVEIHLEKDKEKKQKSTENKP